MNSENFAEWLSALPVRGRIQALALMQLDLSVGTRQMFLPDWKLGENRRDRAIEVLQGLNEIHHTISTQLVSYATNDHGVRPINVLAEMLLEIERKFRLENLLAPAIDFAQTRPLMATSADNDGSSGLT